LVAVVPAVVYLHDLGVARLVEGRRVFRPERWPTPREAMAAVLPIGVCGVVLLVHNQLYFGNPLSTGYGIHSATDTVSWEYGLESWHYIWPNFVIDFLRFPNFDFTGLNDAHPQVDLSAGGIGTSIFFSTPLMLVFLTASQGKASCRWMRLTLWAATAALFAPVIIFQAAGAVQVGARYLFPLYPPLFLLLAMRAGRIGPRWLTLAGLGIFSNLLLARTFWFQAPSSEFVAGSAVVVVVVCVVAGFLLARESRREDPGSAPDAEPGREVAAEMMAV